MEKILGGLLFVFASIAVGQPSSETNVIRLICVYSHSINYEGRPGATPSEELFTVTYKANGEATVTRNGHRPALFPLVGTITQEEIKASVDYGGAPFRIHESVVINRFTGAIEFYFKPGDGGLTSFGKCEPVQQPKF